MGWVVLDSKTAGGFHDYDYARVTINAYTTSGVWAEFIRIRNKGDSYWVETASVTRESGVRYRARYSGTFNGSSVNVTLILEPYETGEKIANIPGSYNTGGNFEGTIYLEKYVPTPPSTPSSISVPSSIKEGESFTVSWGSGSGATSYRLERSVNGGSWTQIYSGSSRSYSDTALASWNTVGYRVRAYNSDGYSSYRTSSAVTITHNSSPSTPSYINVPSTVKSGNSFTISWGKSTDPDGDSVSYGVERSVNGGSYSQIYNGSNLNTSDTAQSSWNTVLYRVRAYDGEDYSSYRTSNTITITHNSSPTLVLDTTDGRTLYENDTLTISGNAKDTDSGNVVTVKYSINGGTTRAIATAISDGSNIPFNKTLIFKQNKLYDGTTAITGDLAEGAQHTLKVWAEDDQGGKSEEITRVFYVVPNRPATLTINPFSAREDLIDSDYITISGHVTDPDNNDVTVSYKIGNGSYKDIYNGTGGDFQFQVQLADLAVGKNVLTIQAKDSYGATIVKTLEVTKAEDLKPLLTSVARYKLSPPNGTAKGVVLWIEREVGDLDVSVEISMGANGEEENFVPMTKTSTAFVREGIEEDEWIYEADSPKENIIIKITMTRTSTNSNKGITLISGVLS